MPETRKYAIKPVEMPELGEADREILGKTVDDGVYPLFMAKEIRLDRIKPDPNQPRARPEPERLKELAASIREQGVLNPIGVQYLRQEDCFMIIHGERRWKAAKMAGLETIPAIIRKVDEEERLIQQLVENIQREDLNVVDRGEALKRLRENLGLPSWEAVGKRIGVSRVRVHQLLATTELPQEIQEDLRAGLVSEKDTRAYTNLPYQHQLTLHQAQKEGRLTKKQVIRTAQILKAHPYREGEEVIQDVKAEEKPPGKSPSKRREDELHVTVQNAINLNRQMQKALSDLSLNDLSPRDREELKEILASLLALAGKLMARLEARASSEV